MGQLYLVRHGQASFGAADYDQLSPLGVEQAQVLGRWFAHCGHRFTRVVTGGLKRHRQTADACLAAIPDPQRPATLDADRQFDEYDHEDVLTRHRERDPVAAHDEGKSNATMEKLFRAAMERWMSGAHDGDYRESWTQFRKRCLGGLQQLVDESGASQSVLVFTSGGPIAVICQHVLGLSDRQTANLTWSLANASVTKLLYRPDRISLSYLNSFAHFEHGAPKSITYR
ncbi:MAG TPA: histidine phosphatase family protein [Nevskiaceae bacterium]|nr:histidine phosphatase family protein [Nevskiaceae bacterium]